MSRRYAAVDLGASSGRVLVGTIGKTALEIEEVHRFANEPVRLPSGLHWDILGLYRNIRQGLAEAGPVVSAGIDSWAADYGLIDEDGSLLGLPFHHRDDRTAALPEWSDPAVLWRTTGIADQPSNTLHQMRAEGKRRLEGTAHLLMIPDLLAYWLTGEIGAEHTNASTTQLCGIKGAWSAAVASEAGIDPSILPQVRRPGDRIGDTDLGTPLFAVASHDTASAVAALPAESDRFAYISCDTRSLVGLELERPVLNEAARLAGFTNEAGVDDTVRFLRNVMGLWLLQECQRFWGEYSLGHLLAEAVDVKPLAALIDSQDPVWLPRGDEQGGMPARIAERAVGRTPKTRGEIVRCILESLALGHRNAIAEASALAGREVEAVHVVGGGAQNTLLCQLTADATGLPVLAGPVEATALGNFLVQARADGVVKDLEHLRSLVRETQQVIRYNPRPSADWDAAAACIEVRS
jgi:rhamnulokinase